MTKILRLRSDNVKRLQAVEIEPDGNTVIIGGNNGQGKTSVLDSIAYALGGKDAIPSQPIRNGEEKASIVVETDNLIVTREFTNTRTHLKVTSRDGAMFPSPQKMLDGMLGRLSFDPLAFSRMKPAEQAAALRDMLGLSTAEIDEQRKAVFDERTFVNREHKSAKANLDAAPKHIDAPAERVSVEHAMQELEAANAHNTKIASIRERLSQSRVLLETDLRVVEEYEKKLASAKTVVEGRREQIAELTEDVEAAGPSFDTAPISDRITRAGVINDKIEANQRWAELSQRVTELKAKSDGLSEQIKALDDQKHRVLTDAEYPVDGLGLSEDGAVTFNGIPFDQSSAAEQLRVSVAVGLAMNPELRVMLVRDGSLLDDNSMSLLAELASENDAQIWIERVGDGDESAVIIEDGMVASVAEPEAATA